MWQPGPEAWREFEALVVETRQSGRSLDWFERQLRLLAECHGWGGVIPITDRRRHRAFARGIYVRFSSIEYGRHRLSQLREGDFGFWVYHLGDPLGACAGEHADFDGVALPPDHPFWNKMFPPSCPECRCYVSGTCTHAGIVRLGGHPEKALPGDWATRGAPKGWRAMWPDLRGVFAEAMEDIALY